MKLQPFRCFAAGVMGLVASCATIPVMGDPAVTVFAQAETVPVGTTNEDAADDPAIWRNNADPASSLIVGTDKKGGLYVYNLSGEQLSFMPAAGLNNVDLVELPDGEVLVAASDRSDLATAHVQLATLDKSSGKLTPTERIEVGSGEGYGICMIAVAADNSITIISAPKNGIIYRTDLALAGEGLATRTLTTVPSQPEGCVIDPRTNTLYIGEEMAGIWAIDLDSGDKRLVASVDNAMLVADVEGLALAPEGDDAGYLIASSQGDNAYAVYALPEYEPVGRFRIAAGSVGSVEETDGIELDTRGFGPQFPAGLFVAQDGINPPRAQNFKLVRWDEIIARLKGSPQN
ncbi:3-phytase [Erythrobacter sp. KY5]|nr:3-phytase [Erythrobacter sp. KY5]